jgi:hypothetical protein
LSASHFPVTCSFVGSYSFTPPIATLQPIITSVRVVRPVPSVTDPKWTRGLDDSIRVERERASGGSSLTSDSGTSRGYQNGGEGADVGGGTMSKRCRIAKRPARGAGRCTAVVEL